MVRALLLLLAPVIVCGTINRAMAELVGYDFTGTVTFPFSPLPPAMPFGFPVAANTAVSGRFVYDTTSSPTHTIPSCTGGCTGAGYLQDQVGGFTATFGGVSVSTDEYLIDVQDNSAAGDQVAIRWQSGLTPALTSDLVVSNGTATVEGTMGLFAVNLVGPSTLFTGVGLPASLGASNFSVDGSSFFQDTPTGALDVIFVIESLTEAEIEQPAADPVALPEPSTAFLLGIGLAAWGRRFRKSGRM